MIYFAQAEIGGPVKIGWAKSCARSRVRSLQTGCPFKIALLGTIEGSLLEEARIHRALRHERVHGEWFAGSDTERAIADRLGRAIVTRLEESSVRGASIIEEARARAVDAERRLVTGRECFMEEARWREAELAAECRSALDRLERALARATSAKDAVLAELERAVADLNATRTDGRFWSPRGWTRAPWASIHSGGALARAVSAAVADGRGTA